MMRFISVAALGLTLLAGPAFADNACPSKELAQQATSALQSAARQRSAPAFVAAASRYIDLNELSLSALGTYRNKLSSAQQAKYLVAARKFIGKFLVDNADKIPTSGVASVQCNGAGMATVRFASGTAITFRLAGPNRVSDVLIIGISVQGAMRSYFTGIITRNNGDVNALITSIAP